MIFHYKACHNSIEINNINHIIKASFQIAFGIEQIFLAYLEYPFVGIDKFEMDFELKAMILYPQCLFFVLSFVRKIFIN